MLWTLRPALNSLSHSFEIDQNAVIWELCNHEL